MTAVLGEIQFTKDFFIIHIFTKKISFACAFAVFLLFLNPSEWLLLTVTVIFPLFWIFFEKKQCFNINLFVMAMRL